MTTEFWTVDIGLPAERDIADILDHTRREFGDQQAEVYLATLLASIEALAQGPDAPGSRRRDDIMTGLRTLHVARGGRRGRHMVVYRIVAPRTVRVLRFLHDRMDFARHLPPEA